MLRKCAMDLDQVADDGFSPTTIPSVAQRPPSAWISARSSSETRPLEKLRGPVHGPEVILEASAVGETSAVELAKIARNRDRQAHRLCYTDARAAFRHSHHLLQCIRTLLANHLKRADADNGVEGLIGAPQILRARPERDNPIPHAYDGRACLYFISAAPGLQGENGNVLVFRESDRYLARTAADLEHAHTRFDSDRLD